MPATEDRESQKCLGIDFGMNSSVIAMNGGNSQGIFLMEFPGWSRNFSPGGDNQSVPVIPSLIRYDDNGSILIGEQVFL